MYIKRKAGAFHPCFWHCPATYSCLNGHPAICSLSAKVRHRGPPHLHINRLEWEGETSCIPIRQTSSALPTSRSPSSDFMMPHSCQHSNRWSSQGRMRTAVSSPISKSGSRVRLFICHSRTSAAAGPAATCAELSKGHVRIWCDSSLMKKASRHPMIS